MGKEAGIENEIEAEVEAESSDDSFVMDLFGNLDADTGDGESEAIAGVETPTATEGGGAQADGSSGDADEKVSEPASAPAQTPAGAEGQESKPSGTEGVPAAEKPDTSAAQKGATQEGTQPEAGVPEPDPLSRLSAEVDKNREVFTSALAESVYKLKEEELDEINVSPEVAIPKLLARAHVNIVQNVLGTLAQQLPNAIGGVLKAREVQSNLESEFFDKWKQLDKSKHRDTVLQIASNYRKMNPTADKETMMRFVGAQAVVMLGLPVGQQAPAAPAAVPKSVPFQPAGVSAPAAVAAAGGNDDNPWAVMSEMLDDS